MAQQAPSRASKKKKAEPAPAAQGTKTPQDDEFGPKPPPPATDNVLIAVPKREPFGRGKLLFGARAGGAFPEVVSNFGPSFLVGLEVGWVLPRIPKIGEGLAVTIDLAYSQPEAGGTVANIPNAGDNTIKWNITQRELSLGLTVLYRIPNIKEGRLTPYIGIGPRIFMLSSLAKSESGGVAATAFNESSTRIGMGLPLGVEYALGPGRIFGEAMFLYAPFNHNATGASNAGALTVEVGYRFLLGLGG
jgi:hypothetical protein